MRTPGTRATWRVLGYAVPLAVAALWVVVDSLLPHASAPPFQIPCALIFVLGVVVHFDALARQVRARTDFHRDHGDHESPAACWRVWFFRLPARTVVGILAVVWILLAHLALFWGSQALSLCALPASVYACASVACHVLWLRKLRRSLSRAFGWASTALRGEQVRGLLRYYTLVSLAGCSMLTSFWVALILSRQFPMGHIVLEMIAFGLSLALLANLVTGGMLRRCAAPR